MGRFEPRRIEERLLSEILLATGMVILALVQVALLPTPLGFSPALVLVVVICQILIVVRQARPDWEVGRILRGAFYSGLVLDLFSATPLGSHILALLIAAILVFTLVHTLHIEGPMVPFLAMLPGGIVYELVLAFIYRATVTSFSWPPYALVVILPGVLVMLILTLPIFFFIRWRSGNSTRPTGKTPLL